MNCAKKRSSGFVANLPLQCKSLALKYFTGEIVTCCSAVYPYLPLGNNTGNASSSSNIGEQ